MGGVREDFVPWINQQLDERGWSRSEAARRGEFSPSMLDKVIGGFAQPGLDFCRGIARAFNMPLEDVFRRAGILAELVELPDEAKGWGERLMYLTAEDRAAAVAMMDQVLRFAEDRPQYRARRRKSES